MLAMLQVDSTSTTAAANLRDVIFEVPEGAVHGPARPQRRRQNHAAQVPDGCCAGADRGSVTSKARTLRHCRRYERARLGIGYVPQGREIFPVLPCEENLEMGLAPKRGRSKLPSRIFEMFPGAEGNAEPARR